MADAVARDLGEKHAQLSMEYGRLCEEREAIQTQILAVRSELTENGQQLKRIEDACVRTRSMAERQRMQVAAMQEQALRAESDLVQANERLPSAAFERTRLEEEAGLQKEHMATLTEQNARLRLDQAELSSRLVELESAVEGQSKEHVELMSQARVLTSEHASEEQSIARQQFTCARLEGQVSALRSENAQAQKQVLKLHEAGDNAETDAKHITDNVMQQCDYLRMQLGSGIVAGGQRAACLETMVDIRSRLEGAEADYQALQTRMTASASKFAEETGPMYSEVQRLHAALSELRKFDVSSGAAMDQGSRLAATAAAMPTQASSSALGPGGRSDKGDTAAEYQRAEMWSRPPLASPQTLGGGLPSMAAGRAGGFQSTQRNAAAATFGWADGEVNQLVAQLQESASRREEIRQRLDLRRLGRV